MFLASVACSQRGIFPEPFGRLAHHVYVTDDELASGIADGSVEALQALIDRYHAPIYRYLRNLGGTKEDAEDLAIQALFKVRSAIRAFRHEGSLRSWIFQVAYREFLIWRRRQVLTLRYMRRVSDLEDPPSEDAVDIEAALAKVPVSQRAAFMLVEIEGLTVDEASTALGVPQGTIKSRCFHAKKRLQVLLGQTYGETNVETVID